MLKARPDLEIGAPTVRWVGGGDAGHGRAARDDFPGAHQDPGADAGGRRATRWCRPTPSSSWGCGCAPAGTLIVPAARHELFMENDAIRGQVFAAFDAFITEPTT